MEERLTRKENPAVQAIRRLLLAWLTAAAVEYLLLPGQERSLTGLSAPAGMSLLRLVCMTGGVFLLLWIAGRFCRDSRWERWGMAGDFLVLAAAGLLASFTWAMLAACLLILVVLVVYALRGWDDSPLPEPAVPVPERSIWKWVTAALAAAFVLFVSAWLVCRVRSFSTPSFDFGLFSQMFYNMRTTGQPITTLERDGTLSHFAVHVSPIYYLMLPFYCLVPRPETLQVLQALILASAVIPLWKLGKLHGLSAPVRTLLCAALLLYPAYAGSTGYDLHENAFLTPLILWLFYGVDRRSWWRTALSGVLVLMVKEDAAVYTAVIALWLMVTGLLHRDGARKFRLSAGALLLAVSLGYFWAVTGYLATSGDGVMSWRYNNFLYNGSSSLIAVVLCVILCPLKAVFECVDAEKLGFIALTLLPLLGLPLLTRRYERYLLLIPWVLVNLMPDYTYQHDIFFQYTNGSAACLFYLAMVNLADFHLEPLRLKAAAGSVLVAAGCFCGAVVPRAVPYITNCVENREHYDAIREKLDAIPQDASVCATTFYTTCLSSRETLYDLHYAQWAHVLESEYVVVGIRDTGSLRSYDTGSGDGYKNLTERLEAAGYTLVDGIDGTLAIFRRS